MLAAWVWTCHISLLASMSCMHLATSMCHIFHSLTTYISHRRANGVYWGLEGCPKAGNTGGTPWCDRCFHMLGLPIKSLTLLKFQTLKFLFLYLQDSYEIYENLLKNLPLYSRCCTCLQPAFHPVYHASWWRPGSKANKLNCSLHFCLFLFPFPSSFSFWLGVYLGLFVTTSYCWSSAEGREAPFVPCVCVCVCVYVSVCICVCVCMWKCTDMLIQFVVGVGKNECMAEQATTTFQLFWDWKENTLSESCVEVYCNVLPFTTDNRAA